VHDAGIVIRNAVVLLALVASVAAGCVAPSAKGPLPSPRVSCNGLPQAKCDEALASVARSLPTERIVAIEVTCVSGACSPETGAMDTVVTLEDGRTLRGTGLSWSDGSVAGGGGNGKFPIPVPGGPVPPDLPVKPECQGVPDSYCFDMATGWGDDGGHGAVIQIVVRCTKVPCTEKNGEGDTVVTFADGTSSTSSWGYSSS
jgi:hypothetical protein